MSRSKTSKAWLRRHVTDPWVQKSQVDGYRSRAAYKLKQIEARDHLFRSGMVVVDLGAAPGGWSQVSAHAVGPKGRVIALDLLDMAPVPGVEFIRGDFGEETVLADLVERLQSRRVDLVLSDMAPNFSGIAGVDQARVSGLAELALDFAERFLADNGAFVVKVFHGVGFDDLLRRLRRTFVKVAIRKPDASRKESSETYIVAKGLRQRRLAAAEGNELGLESDQAPDEPTAPADSPLHVAVKEQEEP
ncbi:MAG: 23S rRNA methyltransferase [Betaproteobacteria bacterium]|nr:23S rRNA methyltransferase [Betaproteobacteria bacterium]